MQVVTMIQKYSQLTSPMVIDSVAFEFANLLLSFLLAITMS